MHPELFSVGNFTVHTYGFLIMIGATSGYFYLAWSANKDLGIDRYKIQNILVLAIILGFVGGKLFFYLENPDYYFSSFSKLTKNFRSGFVFYGSLLFASPAIVWYFRKQNWPFWPMMDRLAIAACIVHGTGRLGCFFAGCCHGIETDVPWAVTFTDQASQAPLHTPLHPTQLYSSTLIFSILILLLMFKRHKRFEGQLFFIYIILYALGRSIIEIFRGDEERGFIVDDILSHSQFISIVVIAIAIWAYFKFKKKADFQK